MIMLKSTLESSMCGVPERLLIGSEIVIIYINELRNVSDIAEFSVFVKYTNIFRFAYIQNVL